jgi:hypothetical protein
LERKLVFSKATANSQDFATPNLTSNCSKTVKEQLHTFFQGRVDEALKTSVLLVEFRPLVPYIYQLQIVMLIE